VKRDNDQSIKVEFESAQLQVFNGYNIDKAHVIGSVKFLEDSSKPNKSGLRWVFLYDGLNIMTTRDEANRNPLITFLALRI